MKTHIAKRIFKSGVRTTGRTNERSCWWCTPSPREKNNYRKRGIIRGGTVKGGTAKGGTVKIHLRCFLQYPLFRYPLDPSFLFRYPLFQAPWIRGWIQQKRFGGSSKNDFTVSPGSGRGSSKNFGKILRKRVRPPFSGPLQLLILSVPPFQYPFSCLNVLSTPFFSTPAIRLH